jgi:hypothetical protein
LTSPPLKVTIISQPAGVVWITLKSPTFMSHDMLRANVCNGSLISKLTKSSNLTGKNSYCILTTGHHKCILTKYMSTLKKTV